MVGVATSVVVLEVALQTIEATPLWRVLPLVEPILGLADADTGYAFVPGADGIWTRENRALVHINSLGTRNPEMPREKPAGTTRVGVTGDSLVEALQVDQSATFLAQAEARLNAAGYPAQILNLAMSGNGPLRQLVRLEKMAPGLDLDLSVAFLSAPDFLTGELLDDGKNPGYVPDGAGGLTRGYAFRNRFAVRAMKTWYGRELLELIRHSVVVRMLYLWSREPLEARLGLPATAVAWPSKPSQVSCGQGMMARLRRLWHDRQPMLNWLTVEKVLDEFAAVQAAQGFPVLLVVDHLPLPAPDCPEEVVQRAELVEMVRRDVERRGMGFVDWRSHLAEVAAVEGVELRMLTGFGSQRGRGGHLNHLGHDIYARELTRMLPPYLAARK